MSQQHLIDNDEFCNRETIRMNIEHLQNIAANLEGVDCSDLSHLLEFIGDFAKPVRPALELFGEATSKTIKQTIKLRQFAANKLTAMQARVSGNINLALYLEGICDGIYDSMAEEYQW